MSFRELHCWTAPSIPTPRHNGSPMCDKYLKGRVKAKWRLAQAHTAPGALACPLQDMVRAGKGTERTGSPGSSHRPRGSGAGQAGRGAKGGPSGFSESGCFPAVTLTDLKKNKPLATDMWGEGNEDNQGSSDKRPGHS